MTFDETMAALAAAGSEQTCKTYRRHGVPDPMFGVSHAVLGTLTRRIKRDQALAERLWATGNADARTLATMVADPGAADLEAWARATGYHVLAGHVADLAARSPRAHALALGWLEDEAEIVARIGWHVLARLANDPQHADELFMGFLPRIEREIHQAPNRLREAMNTALIAFGGRSEAGAELAIAAARRIGPVKVDHGDTACKTPAAEPYILKMRDRARARAGKK